MVACSSGSKGGGTGPEPGIAAALELLTAPPVTTVSRSLLTPAPVVQVVDINGDPVDSAGIAVTAALVGSGTLTGTTVVATDANGQATFSNLSMRGLAGGKALAFTASQVVGVQSGNVTLTAGAAAVLVATSATSQSLLKGSAVTAKPAVAAQDLDGNGVAGVAVTFALTVGNGSITGANQVTSASGAATIGSWTLDTAAGPNSVTASATGLTGSPLTFNATGTNVSSQFTIDIQFLGSGTPSQQAAFSAAKAKWEQVIIGDLANFTGTLNASSCGNPAFTGTIDDVLIYVDLVPIDGPGQILGAAGPCYIRVTGSLTILGYMKFDTADLADLELNGSLSDVALHEMGHVLGYGTLWSTFGLQNLVSGTDPFFVGSFANAAYLTEGGAAGVSPANCGANVPRSAVPLQVTGGAGTALSHWEECVFRSEVMTGFISGNARPLSKTSIQSLADLGYSVNANAADLFNLATQPTLRAGEAEAGPVVDLTQDRLGTPIMAVDQNGRVVKVFKP
ncbi:MAG: hypothetical protein JNM53_07970 [Gemmatimonadetes bacterium]|nr:hypothetical protein [Gemmatimonadota bacterium]